MTASDGLQKHIIDGVYLFYTSIPRSVASDRGSLLSIRSAALSDLDATIGDTFMRTPFCHSSQYSPSAVLNMPLPCCRPSFHSPSYSRPSGHVKTPVPSFLSFT